MHMNWQEIFAQESTVLFHYLISTGCSRDLAEDVIQDVFLACLSSTRTPIHVRAYLFAAVRRELGRSKNQLRLTEAVVDLVAPQENDAHDQEVLEAALSQLPVPQREIVILRIWHAMSFVEIGEVLEISKDTAASRWRYGIEKLKGIL